MDDAAELHKIDDEYTMNLCSEACLFAAVQCCASGRMGDVTGYKLAINYLCAQIRTMRDSLARANAIAPRMYRLQGNKIVRWDAPNDMLRVEDV